MPVRLCRIQARLKVADAEFETWKWGIRAASNSEMRELSPSGLSVLEEMAAERKKLNAAEPLPPIISMVHDQKGHGNRSSASLLSLPEAQIRLK